MALPQAGAPATAQMLATLVNAELQTVFVAATGTINYTGATVDSTPSVSFTTSYPNTVVMCWGTFDATINSGIATFIGYLNVDGTRLTTGEAHLVGESAASTRATIMQVWVFTVASAGSHTLKLQGTGANTATFATHTKLHALVFGP